MATNNAVNTSLSGQSGTGAFAGTTSPTLTTPKIAQINDSNGNASLNLTVAASAVNNISLTNAATGSSPQVSAIGSDSNIGLIASSKGTGAIIEKSANTTVPVQWLSGTTYQHTTNFAISNTAASRTVTLQDSDGTVAYLTDRNLIKIQTQTANNSASVMDFTGMTGYSNYMLVLDCLTVTTNGSTLGLLGSINNGSTFLTSSGDYNTQAILCTAASITTAFTSTTAFIPLAPTALGSNAAGGLSSTIMLMGLDSTTLRKGVNSEGLYFNSSSAGQSYTSYSQIVTASAVNAIRLGTTAGNLFAGTAILYGIK